MVGDTSITFCNRRLGLTLWDGPRRLLQAVVCRPTITIIGAHGEQFRYYELTGDNRLQAGAADHPVRYARVDDYKK